MSKCSIDGCDKLAKARSWCDKHYTMWQRHGDPLYKREFKKDERCIAPNCERNQKAKGYCWTHYKKINDSGTLERKVHGPEWRAKMSASRKTELSNLDSTPDPKGRGYLAVNIVNDLKYKARQRGIEWTLTPVDAYKLIIGDCLYHGGASGWPKTRNGIDRVDNSKGYHVDNCVSCCTICNSAKMGRSLEEFIDWIKQVYHNITKR